MRCVLLSAFLAGSAAVAQSTTPPLNFSGLPTPGLAKGAPATYGVALAEVPTSSVYALVGFGSPLKALGEEVPGGEAWPSFTVGNWNVPQTVTISVIRDEGNNKAAIIRRAVGSDIHDDE